MTNLQKFRINLQGVFVGVVPVFEQVENMKRRPNRFYLLEYLGEGEILATLCNRSARYLITYGSTLSEGDFEEDRKRFNNFIENYSQILKHKVGKHIGVAEWARTESWEIEIQE